VSDTNEGGLRVLSPNWFESALHYVALGAEVAGVAVIVLGVMLATTVFLLRIGRSREWGDHYHTFRSTLARAILLGLEFLLAADLVGTVAVKPTLDNLYVLGLIVLIRTFLSFSLQVEIEGRLPWRKADSNK